MDVPGSGNMQPRFEVIEHTADVGVRGFGRTLAEAFGEVARGMYAQMVDLDAVRDSETREFSVSAPTRKRLLVAFLLELLYFTDSEGLLFRRFELAIDEQPTEGRDANLRATAFGERIDPTRHRLGVQVKAVTRHLLEVAETDTGYQAQVILDI